ncbi:B-cell receptor CD22-like, partial [Clupea harengus]|uniref:B-cell receptor CD22-like n=1 Tax=Clupea harengus TaxID=7950 RepID=A0A6P8F0U8_CLUHA
MWSKDGHPVEKKRSINNQMQLHPVRYEDGGNYTCAVEGHEDRPSPAMILNVQYPPRNTLVSITFSMETLEGAIVTLTCSSDANPPVEIYTWFKVGESTPVGSGQQYNITNFSSEDGGQYYCEARNEHGAYNSTAVSITVTDAVASEWNVTYEQLHICAVEGSSVDMSCSYTYPRDRILEKVFWTIINSRDPPDLIQDEKYKERIRTDCGDRKSGSCTLNLKGVKREDAVMYYCRIVTNGTTYGTFLGKPGVTLYLTDLNVRGAQNAKEGDIVNLTCENTCPQRSSPSFMWSKDGHPVEKKKNINNQLQLHPVRYEDGGSYTCAVKGHEDLPSPAMILNVQYSPKETNVSLSSSGQLVEGNTLGYITTLEGASVTLTCSSDANPPVENYNWFKVGESTPVGSGQQYNITDIRNEDGGQYYCEAKNEVGADNSSVVLLHVTSGGRGTVMYALIAGAAGVGVALLCGAVWMRHRNGNKETRREDVDGHQYANTGFQRSLQSIASAPASAEAAGGAEDVPQYSTIQPHGSR